jgi:predicted nucleotidyltransferase component of viral defense system
MKYIFVAIFLLQSSIQENPVFDIEINTSTTADSLKEYKELAESLDIDFNINYVSYNEQGTIKTLQLEVVWNEFTASTTRSFKKGACFKVFVDTSLKEKEPFGIRDCPK